MLNSELELLNLIKTFRRYRDLRKEEFVLKVTLKNKIAQALEALADLEKKLPKSSYKPDKKEAKEEIESRERNLTLEQEIAEVRRKLEHLHSHM